MVYMISKLKIMSNPLIAKIIKNLGANFYGQGITILTQIVSLPIFLYFWNTEVYGQWLLIYAIPGYLALADFGINSIAANKVSMLFEAGKKNSAYAVFQTALATNAAVFLVVNFIAIIGLFFIPWILPFDKSMKFAIFFLILSTLFSIVSSLFDCVFRANNDYARGTYLLNTVRLTEWCGSMIGLIIGRTIVSVSIGLLLGRMLGFFILLIITKKQYRDFKWTMQGANKKDFSDMLKPSIAFMGLPIGNALSLQGVTFIIGTTLGPTALTTFNAYRTLSRFITQTMSMFCKSIWPEFTRLYGGKQFETLSNLYKKSNLFFICMCTVSSLITLLLIPYIVPVWSHGQIPVLPNLIFIFTLLSIISAVPQVSNVLLLSTNQHTNYSFYYFLITLLSFPLNYLAAKEFGIEGIASTLVFSEALIAIVSVYSAIKLVFYRLN